MSISPACSGPAFARGLAATLFATAFLSACTATPSSDGGAGPASMQAQSQAQSSQRGAATGAATGTATGAGAAKYQVKDDAPRLSEIRDQNIEPGTCGMLLWTLEAGTPLMVFRTLPSGAAQMTIDGEEVELAAVSKSGEMRFGVASNQSFTLEAGTPGETRVKVATTYGTAFEGGIYIESGVISLRNFFGWERVTPVAGLAGCRA